MRSGPRPSFRLFKLKTDETIDASEPSPGGLLRWRKPEILRQYRRSKRLLAHPVTCKSAPACQEYHFEARIPNTGYPGNSLDYRPSQSNNYQEPYMVAR